MMHRAEEDYIKNIYKLTIEQNRDIVRNNEIADIMGNTDQTVNEMVRRLASKGIVTFTPYKGVSLTKKGLNEAIRLIRNHRLWEIFLVQKLNYPWTKVHEEAEKLEHVSSEALMNHIYEFLDKPEFCAHGNLIPKFDGKNIINNQISLTEANIGDKFIIKRVMDKKQFLDFLDEKGIKLGFEIEIVNKDSFSKLLTIRFHNQDIIISTVISDKMYGIIAQQEKHNRV